MGERVAHLLNGRLIDSIGFGDEFAIARLKAPEAIVGLPGVSRPCLFEALRKADLRDQA